MNRRKSIAAFTAIALVVGLGYAMRAGASGIPTSKALSYSGVLEDANGLVDGKQNIQVIFFDAPTAGNNLCQSTTEELTITSGRFSVTLPDTCTNVVAA